MSYSGAGYASHRTRSSNEEQPLARYLAVLRERVWIIVLCTLLVVGAAVAYVKLAPRTYQAQAEMEVQAAGNSDAALAALPVLHQTTDPTQDVLTAASLVTTQPVAAAVVQSLHLKISPNAALASVQASPIGQAGLIAVQASASSPNRARNLANAFVEQTIALSTARMHAAIQAALPTLRSQVAAVPRGQRYGPGSLGAQLDELEQLLNQNDPTLVSAALATKPTAPSWPRTKLSVIAAAFAGLLLGIGVAFLFHSLDPRVRREEQLRDRLGVPVLARIPRQRQRRRRRRQRGPRPLLPSELSLSAQEGYRTLRTILTARARSAEPRAVLVTGCAPAEGKSTTALGLAAALAQDGARVILIEADLRKPTFAASFKLASFIGIESVLNGTAPLSDAIVPVVMQDTYVYLLPAHPLASRGPRFPIAGVHNLVTEAKAIADFVVVDSAPLTTVIDALPFAQASDDVLIVARLGQTRLNRLEELDDLLMEHGVARTGIVLIGEHPPRGLEYYVERDGTRADLAPASPAVPEQVGEAAHKR